MIIRNFAVTQNAVINTVMSYQICRQVLNKYIASLNTSCLTMEYIFTQWLFVLEQYAEFGLLFVLQWEYFLQLSEKYSSFSISRILLL